MDIAAPKIGIVGDRNPEYRVHLATEGALQHVSAPLPIALIPMGDAAARTTACLACYAGLTVAPGSPYRSMEGALEVLRHARERQARSRVQP